MQASVRIAPPPIDALLLVKLLSYSSRVLVDAYTAAPRRASFPMKELPFIVLFIMYTAPPYPETLLLSKSHFQIVACVFCKLIALPAPFSLPSGNKDFNTIDEYYC